MSRPSVPRSQQRSLGPLASSAFCSARSAQFAEGRLLFRSRRRVDRLGCGGDPATISARNNLFIPVHNTCRLRSLTLFRRRFRGVKDSIQLRVRRGRRPPTEAASMLRGPHFDRSGRRRTVAWLWSEPKSPFGTFVEAAPDFEFDPTALITR